MFKQSLLEKGKKSDIIYVKNVADVLQHSREGGVGEVKIENCIHVCICTEKKIILIVCI